MIKIVVGLIDLYILFLFAQGALSWGGMAGLAIFMVITVANLSGPAK